MLAASNRLTRKRRFPPLALPRSGSQGSVASGHPLSPAPPSSPTCRETLGLLTPRTLLYPKSQSLACRNYRSVVQSVSTKSGGRGLLIVESAPLPSSRLQPGPRTRRRFWFPKTPLTQGWGLDSGCGRKDWGIQLNDPGAQTRSKAAAQFVLQRKAVFPCPWRALDKRLAQVWRNRSWSF